MKRLLPIFLFTAAICAAQSDTFQTTAGDLKITPVRHGTVLLQIAGKSWYVDPWSQADYSTLPKADVILITDIHGDHMDPKAIAQIAKDGTVIVAPKAVAATVKEAKVIGNGDKTTVNGVEIEAVPMYNLKRGPEDGKLYHDKGRGNGYVLNIGGKRVYFSGDTEVTDEMKALKNIDVAYICMNLPYTMPPDEAAAGVKAFRPKVVYPYHFRGSDLGVFENALKGENGIEVRVRNWY